MLLSAADTAEASLAALDPRMLYTPNQLDKWQGACLQAAGPQSIAGPHTLQQPPPGPQSPRGCLAALATHSRQCQRRCTDPSQLPAQLQSRQPLPAHSCMQGRLLNAPRIAQRYQGRGSTGGAQRAPAGMAPALCAAACYDSNTALLQLAAGCHVLQVQLLSEMQAKLLAPGRAVAAQQVGSLCVLVAIDDVKALAALLRQTLAHAGLPCACLPDQQHRLRMLPAPGQVSKQSGPCFLCLASAPCNDGIAVHRLASACCQTRRSAGGHSSALRAC